MQRALARQAEAEREKRAKVIHAEGEFSASQQLAAAAEVIGSQPATLQLRYLQTLAEIAAEEQHGRVPVVTRAAARSSEAARARQYKLDNIS